MSDYFWVGAALGFVVGFINFLSIVSSRLGIAELSAQKTLWIGLWIWALWTIFGSYVLVFWIVGLILFGATRLLHRVDER